MPTPNWLAAATGQVAQASQINQFLGTHAVTYIDVGVGIESHIGTPTGTLNTNTGAAAQWVAQNFVTAASGTGSTTTTRIEMYLALNGTGADMTVEVRTDSAGVPSNTVLLSLTFPGGSFLTSTNTLWSIPIPVTGLTANTPYWVVFDGTASTANYNKIGTIAAVASRHAFTSPSGTGTWTDAGVTAGYTSVAGYVGRGVIHTWEDGGLRWTYTPTNNIPGSGTDVRYKAIYEYTKADTVANAVRSARTAVYSTNILQGWS